ncbi:MAG: hypothetical protein KC462_10110, partial [Cyanobacteria bacterium HKST-UBA05]|nr:hypothetical protein [Cyanobacteria bacterium HKST-UBA05]
MTHRQPVFRSALFVPMSSQLLDTAAPLSVPVAEPPKNRLTRQEALELLLDEPLLSLGLQAEAEKAKRFGPDDPVTFVIDRNVNYTN